MTENSNFIGPTCEGPFAHAEIWQGKCPRCGQWQFRRMADETDEEMRERIKRTLAEDGNHG